MLWQRSPVWQAYGRRVFHIYKIALYFLIIITWVAGSALLSSGLADALRSMMWTVPPALAVIAILSLLAWLYGRTTVYTFTNKRVIVQSGLAFTTAINLPFSKLQSADMKTFADDSGDIQLSMTGPRILYTMIWPNCRLFAVKRPLPMLWAVPEPQQAAQILGEALEAEQRSGPSASASANDDTTRLDRAQPS